MTSNASSALFDANVWLALCHTAHSHHRQAVAALPEIGPGTFCRVTQMALLRFLTRPEIMGPDLVSPREAWQYFDRLIEEKNAAFLEEPPQLKNDWKKFSAALPAASGNAWTDTYLAAFAKSSGLQLVTFDRGFRKFHGLDCRIL